MTNKGRKKSSQSNSVEMETRRSKRLRGYAPVAVQSEQQTSCSVRVTETTRRQTSLEETAADVRRSLFQEQLGDARHMEVSSLPDLSGIDAIESQDESGSQSNDELGSQGENNVDETTVETPLSPVTLARRNTEINLSLLGDRTTPAMEPETPESGTTIATTIYRPLTVDVETPEERDISVRRPSHLSIFD